MGGLRLPIYLWATSPSEGGQRPYSPGTPSCLATEENQCNSAISTTDVAAGSQVPEYQEVIDNRQLRADQNPSSQIEFNFSGRASGGFCHQAAGSQVHA